jgi:hypothetical protein
MARPAWRVFQRRDARAVKVHIERGGVEHMRINQSQGLVNRRCGAHRIAPEIGQHVFKGQTKSSCRPRRRGCDVRIEFILHESFVVPQSLM